MPAHDDNVAGGEHQLTASPSPLSTASIERAGVPLPNGTTSSSATGWRSLDLSELEPLPPAAAAVAADADKQDVSRVEDQNSGGHSSAQCAETRNEGGSCSPSLSQETPYRSLGADGRQTSPNATTLAQEADDTPNHGTVPPTPAQYVTVSSILSRSGSAVPLIQHGHGVDGLQLHQRHSADQAGHSDHRRDAPGFTRRASNGSALEALGALFLHRDSSGKVSNLSAARVSKHHEDQQNEKGTSSRSKNDRALWELGALSRAWLHGVKYGASRQGIKMPSRNESGQTIAQRRARMQTNKRSNEGDSFEYLTVGTSSLQPTFEVGIVTQAPLESRDTTEERLELKPDQYSSLDAPPDAPRLDAVTQEEPSPLLFADDDRLRLRAPALTDSGAVYGVGSAFSFIDPPEAPPSPVGMPGAWTAGGDGWSSDRYEEGALLLPPPLLDDFGSDAKSFEGLLGVRRMREQEQARKRIDLLKARNRPAHKVGMLTAMSNFVKAARAADHAVKASSREKMIRRHTEPVKELNAATPGVANALGKQVSSSTRTPSLVLDEPTSAHSARNTSQAPSSLEFTQKSLPTVYEAEPFDTATSSDDTVGQASMSLTSSLSQQSKNLPAHDHVNPSTPSIGPTLLSLPPSPWTPYGEPAANSSSSAAQSTLLMQLGMTPVCGPSGTPRLAPARLEAAPSPDSASWTPFALSPKTPAITYFDSEGLPAPSPFTLSPLLSPHMGASQRTSLRRRSAKANEFPTTPTDSRLTPSALLQEYPTKHMDKESERPRQKAGPHGHENKAKDRRDDSSAARSRSFLLWFLFGDLGLVTRTAISAKASGSPAPSRTRMPPAYNALLSSVAHTYGFTIFLLAHLVDLGYRCYEALATTLWFLRWLFLNLAGQTVLSQCIADAFRIVRREWETVSKEDHENKGIKPKRSMTTFTDEAISKESQNDRSRKTVVYRGLSKWQVIKSLIELMCLQDVTRERYLREGAGLKELTGWRRSRSGNEAANDLRKFDLGAMARSDAQRKRHDANGHGGADEEGMTISEDDSDQSESSDDDMLVTRRSADILEFTKTPRTESRGYFSARDAGRRRSLVERDSQRKVETRDTKAHSARDIVKIIKWASRLSISAYGLHVTLVDLPETFTPSGSRFSRQTFAHLSRLHHEDVLHADIQALDSEDYSPTFYLVRDVARRVIAVSVRGTQSLQDIVVDLEMVVDKVELYDEGDVLPDEERSAGEVLHCHAGVLRAARALIAHDSALFRNLLQALEANPGFDIVFTGHSLGGAIASTVVLLLSRFELKKNEDGSTRSTNSCWKSSFGSRPGKWVTHDRSGLPAGRQIRAITFAHPATVSSNLAARSSWGDPPLVLTVTLGHDLIPRCGHGQAREMRRVLGALSRVRRRKRHPHSASRRSSLDPGSRYSTLAFESEKNESDVEDPRVHVVTSWWRWRSIKRKGNLASRAELHEMRQIEDALWRLRCDVEGDLYAAVKRRTLLTAQKSRAGSGDSAFGHDGSVDTDRKHLAIPPSPWIGPEQRAEAPLHQLASRRQTLDAITVANEESISQNAGGMLVPAGKSIWLYEDRIYEITSPLSFFGMLDFHVRAEWWQTSVAKPKG